MNRIKEAFERDKFIAKEDVIVTGHSGVKHYFPLVFLKEDYEVAVEYSNGSNIELDLSKLIIKCRDSDIQHAILILDREISISDRVGRMAEESGIKIMIDKD